jgi:hypothetical protein
MSVCRNANYNNGQPMTVPPYDTDGFVSTAFSATELSNIKAIWRGVAEDFAPFDIDVTTEDPSLTNTPLQDWVRAAIGGSSYTYFAAGYGGIAYVNVAFG